jgi:type 1 glutamine amidotransferase
MHKKLPAIGILFFLLIACSGSRKNMGNAVRVDWKKINVLVYTKNGKGYVHDNIAAASACITRLGKQYGFGVTISDNPGDFSESNLSKYQVLVFNNTNNDVFDNDEEKIALMRYIQAGGGFVGLHSATGTERSWAWFKRLIGASFQRHAKHQPFKEIIIDTINPSTAFLPHTWDQDDECYFFKEVNPDLHVLMAHNLSTLLDDKDKPDFYGSSSPSAWCHEFDGGREWYTALGHDSLTYQKPDFEKHILGGIEWVVGQNKPLNYSKAHAKGPNDPLPY